MKTNRSAPTATIVPILVYEDVEQAIEWLRRTLGFTERLRAAHNGVVSHAQLAFAEGAVMIGRQGGPFRAPQAEHVSHVVHVSVADVDAHFAHAQQCGARIVRPPTDMPFGERQYTVEDPGGHWWVISQHIADLAPEDWGATSAPRA
jgi:uncharacterized glyoxalase superfamily protein PhnB